MRTFTGSAVQKFDVFMKYEVRLGHTDATNQTKQEMNLDTASIIWVELGEFFSHRETIIFISYIKKIVSKNSFISFPVKIPMLSVKMFR